MDITFVILLLCFSNLGFLDRLVMVAPLSHPPSRWIMYYLGYYELTKKCYTNRRYLLIIANRTH